MQASVAELEAEEACLRAAVEDAQEQHRSAKAVKVGGADAPPHEAPPEAATSFHDILGWALKRAEI